MRWELPPRINKASIHPSFVISSDAWIEHPYQQSIKEGRFDYQASAGAEGCQGAGVVEDGAGVEAALVDGEAAGRCALRPAPLLHHHVLGQEGAVPPHTHIQAPSEGGQSQEEVIGLLGGGSSSSSPGGGG